MLILMDSDTYLKATSHMAWYRSSTKERDESKLFGKYNILDLTLRNKLRWNINWNDYIFIQSIGLGCRRCRKIIY